MTVGGHTIVPWSSRRRRLAANLQGLAEKDPVGAKLVEAAADGELEKYDLYLMGDGNYQVREKGIWTWLGGMVDHRAAAKAMWKYNRAKQPMPAPILFEGAGFGWLILHVLATTVRTFVDYSCPLYVLEGDPAALAMMFHMHDFQEVFDGPRVRWFVREDGEKALAALRDAIRLNETWTVPTQYVKCAMRPGKNITVGPVIQELLKERAAERDQKVMEARAWYERQDLAHWRERFGTNAGGLATVVARQDPLRVLGITSRYTTVLQHSMGELQKAAENVGGVEFRVAMEADDQSAENPFPRMVAEFKPDLIVLISRMRWENPWLPRNVPFLCWDQDNLPCVRAPEATASLDQLTYVAGHGAVYGFTTLGWPRENCIFCHPAGATFRYHDGPVEKELLEKHACDISYVSNASERPEELAGRLMEKWDNNNDWEELFDRAVERVRETIEEGGTWEHVGLKGLVEEVADEIGLSVKHDGGKAWHEMTVDMNTYADRCFRHVTLAWVHKWCKAKGKKLRLYGRGWEKHPEFAQWASGIAQPGEEARAIFQASKINLQLMEAGFIHSRALDGLAAGGFFLTREVMADGLSGSEAKSIYEVARWAVEHGIKSDKELEPAADAPMREKIARVRAYYKKFGGVGVIWQSLQVWAETPPASVVFPGLERVAFRGEKSFAEMTDRYLGDESLRKRVAGEMRSVVLQHFSYETRWRHFIDGIAKGMKV